MGRSGRLMFTRASRQVVSDVAVLKKRCGPRLRDLQPADGPVTGAELASGWWHASDPAVRLPGDDAGEVVGAGPQRKRAGRRWAMSPPIDSFAQWSASRFTVRSPVAQAVWLSLCAGVRGRVAVFAELLAGPVIRVVIDGGVWLRPMAQKNALLKMWPLTVDDP